MKQGRETGRKCTRVNSEGWKEGRRVKEGGRKLGRGGGVYSKWADKKGKGEKKRKEKKSEKHRR